MFAPDFFAPRYFAPRYFPEVGAAPAAGDGSYFAATYFSGVYFPRRYFPDTGTVEVPPPPPPPEAGSNATTSTIWPPVPGVFWALRRGRLFPPPPIPFVLPPPPPTPVRSADGNFQILIERGPEMGGSEIQRQQRVRRHMEKVSVLLNSCMRNGYIRQVDIDEWRVIGGAFVMDRDPETIDAESVGIQPGMIWVNSSTLVAFINASNDENAPVWIEVAAAGDGSGATGTFNSGAFSV